MSNYNIITMQNNYTSYLWDIINLYILYSIGNINDNYIEHILYGRLYIYIYNLGRYLYMKDCLINIILMCLHIHMMMSIIIKYMIYI